MEVRAQLSIENKKGDFLSVLYLPVGMPWEDAKNAVVELHAAVVELEKKSVEKAQQDAAAQPAADSVPVQSDD